MTRLGRELANRSLFVGALCVCLSACREEVPLGSWDLPPEPSGEGGSTTTVGTTSGTGGGAGAGTDGGEIPVLPGCLEAGTPSALNVAGDGFSATETATDWTWPAPVDSMQFDLMVEREIVREPATAPPSSGYYWAYQFWFLEGAAGYIGIQAEGVYSSDPPDSEIEVEKMAVFWLSGPPLDAELGDIEYPDARIAPITASGVSYSTIHAKFEWQACRTYRFRFAQHSLGADDTIWYGAWIEDVEAQEETFLGRMLLPADSGSLSPFSVSRTIPIEFDDPDSCDFPKEASALFGIPHTVEGDVYSEVGANRFGVPLECPSSRFTEFDGAVRHELGVRP